jgi:hypothetical protein
VTALGLARDQRRGWASFAYTKMGQNGNGITQAYPVIKANPTKRQLRWLATVILLFASALGFPLLAFGSESISDYVRIEPGHVPLAGAVVIAGWVESSVHGEGACRWIASAITEEHGHYKIPAPSMSLFERFSISIDAYPYKPGYVFGLYVTHNSK